MKSIKRLFRPSSLPNDSHCKILNSGVKLKSNLKLSHDDVTGHKKVWTSAKSGIDVVDTIAVDGLDDSKNYAHKDTRRSSIVIGQKNTHSRRRSTLSNSSSISEGSSDISYSDNDENESKKKTSPKELFENKATRKINTLGYNDFCVYKISQASIGKKAIATARREMSGFLSLLKSLEIEKPLKGSRIAGCTHITAQTAVLIEGLTKLGATVRWCACNIYSTQNEVAAALADAGVSVYAWNDESEDEFWWAMDQCINSVDGPFDLVLDEGGDLTERCFKDTSTIPSSCRGIVEESISGIRRLYQIFKLNDVTFPAINISDSVIKYKFDSYYIGKETVIDALKRSADANICGKVVLVIGYGSVGKGCCQALRGMSAQVLVSEIDPICAIQACMEGYKVVLTDEYLPLVDIVITCTGTISLLGVEEFNKMKDGSIVCNMGHCTSEIDIKSLRTNEISWQRMRDDLDNIIFPSKKSVLLIAQGRQANLNCSTVPSIVSSVTAAVQMLALVELYTATDGRYQNQVYLLPKKYDELIAKHHLPAFGAQLNELTENQAKSLGVTKTGPFKSNNYRY